ncbi:MULTISPECIES: autotransporter domain-containing protein [unclassified Phyllobacterium]|uniref:autotransporter domain-containing protein n=1 Tax=unclassified Phyllobacterium TaxID=2638441 RepID=UPI003012B8D1
MLVYSYAPAFTRRDLRRAVFIKLAKLAASLLMGVAYICVDSQSTWAQWVTADGVEKSVSGTIDTGFWLGGASGYALAARNNGKISSNGPLRLVTSGLYARAVSADGGVIDLTGADIETRGFEGVGLHAENNGILTIANSKVTTGNAHTAIGWTGGKLTVTGGSLVSNGSRSRAVWANGGTVELDGVTVTTSQEEAHGLYSGAGNSKLTAKNNTKVNTLGERARAVSAAGGEIDITAAEIETKGRESPALYAAESGILKATNSIATAVNGYGAFSESGGKVTITGGSLTTNSDGNYGAFAKSGTIDFISSEVQTKGSGSTGLYVEYIGVLTTTNTKVTAEKGHAAASYAGGNLRVTGGSMSANGDNRYGAWANGGTIELDGATVTTLGKSAYGLSSEDDKSKITAKNNTKVTTNGHQASGVYVKGGVVDITAAEIETMGPNSTGLYIANGELKAKDTKVTTTTGHGAASDGGKLNISGGSVTANGDEHRGVWALGGTIELDGATVTTLGKSAYGLSSENGKSKITAKNNTKVTTNGYQASGAYAYGGVIDITDSEIETKGSDSTGLCIINGELKAKDTKVTTTTGHGAASDGGKLNISGGSLTANGEGFQGTWANGGTVKLDGVTVSTSGKKAYGLRSVKAGTSLTATKTIISTNGNMAHAVSSENGAELRLVDSTATSLGTEAVGIFSAGDVSTPLSKVFLTNSRVESTLNPGAHTSGAPLEIFASSSSIIKGKEAALVAVAGAKLNVTLDGSTLDGTTSFVDPSTLNLTLKNKSLWLVPGESSLSSLVTDGATLHYGSPANVRVFNTATIGSQGIDVDTKGFNSSLNADFSSIGGLTKSGPGQLTLLGQNTYTGTTTVNGGELLINQGGKIDSASIVNKDALLTIAGTSKDIEVADGGRLAVLASGVSGNLLLNGGSATVDGKAGTTTINASGILGGNGSVDKLFVNSGGISLENSTDLLKVKGDATFAKDSIFGIEIAPDTSTASKVAISGKAYLLGGVIMVTMADDAVVLSEEQIVDLTGKSFEILTAGNGISDQGCFEDVMPMTSVKGKVACSGNKVILGFERIPEPTPSKSENPVDLEFSIVPPIKPKVDEEAKLKADAEAKVKAEQEAKLRAEQEAKQKAEQEAKLKADEETKLKAEQEAKLKAAEEAKLKAEQEAKQKADEEAKLRAEQEAKQKAEQEAKLKAAEEAKLKVDEETKLRAEQEVKLKAAEEAKLRVEQEAKLKADAEAKVKAEQEAKLKAEQEAKLKETVAPPGETKEAVVSPTEPTETVAPPVEPKETVVAPVEPTETVAPPVETKEAVAAPTEPKETIAPLVETKETVAPPVEPKEADTPPAAPQVAAIQPTEVAATADSIAGKKAERVEIQIRDFELIGANSANQKSVGGAIKSLGLGNDLFTDLLRSSRNSTPDYDLLSGEIHATLAGVLIQDSRFISNIAASRLREAFGDNAALKQAVVQPLAYGTQSKPQSSGAALKAITQRDAAMDTRLAVWGQTYGSWANAAENGNADGYSRTVSGIVTGLDGAVSDTWRFGLLAGYSTTSLSTRNGVASVNSYHMGAYGGTQWDVAGNPLGLRFGVNLGRHDISTDRQAEWFATVDGNHATYGATTVQGFGEISYAINTSYGVIEPFAGISHVYLKSDGFWEEGGVRLYPGGQEIIMLQRQRWV